MAIPSITVTPDHAARAYLGVDQGMPALGASGPVTQTDSSAAAAQDFGSVLGRALQGAVDAGHAADTQSMAAISGQGDITSVVMAVNKADLALQTTAAIRDRLVQAYQDIIKMPI